jgi:tetratricopeptide (TPR) repeat protein
MGGLPRVHLAMARAFARLGMNERVGEIVKGIPKLSNEYVPANLLLFEMAEMPAERLAILDRLDKERPGLISVLQLRMQTLVSQGRWEDALAAYRRYADPTGTKSVAITPEIAFLALQASLTQGGYEGASALSEEMVRRTGGSYWRYVGPLLAMEKDLQKAAGMLPRANEADLTQALLGLCVARKAGANARLWSDRVAAIDAAGSAMTPPRPIASPINILVALASGDIGRAQNALRDFKAATIVGRKVTEELVAHAAKGNDVSQEAVALLRASMALDLRLSDQARKWATDVLAKRPESQWAAAIILQTGPDTAERERLVATVKPAGCFIAKLIEGSIAAEKKDFAGTAAIFRQLSEMEKNNPAILRQLATSEALAGNIDRAIATHLAIWEKDKQDIAAANNAAYLLAHQYPNDAAKLKQAQEMIAEVLKVAPNVPAFRDTLGWIAHLQGDEQKALTALRQAVKGLPESIATHAHVAIVELAVGNTALARGHAEAAVKIAGKSKVLGQELDEEQMQGLRLAEKTLSGMTQ